MRNIEKKQIGDFYYRVKQLPDPAGTRLFARLMRLFAPVLGAGLRGMPDTGEGFSISSLSTLAIGDALIMLSETISEDDFMYICETLETDCDFSSNPDDNSAWIAMKNDKTHWSGRYLQKMQWLIFALEVNYSDFLGGRESLVRAVSLIQNVSKSKSPDTSTGE